MLDPDISYELGREIVMGDMGEIFNGMAEESKRRRADNRENSAKILSENGISFESKNMAAHLIVHGHAITVDFWPGTGKWIVRGGKTGRGVFNLMKLVGLKP
jgi:hypothetical protein